MDAYFNVLKAVQQHIYEGAEEEMMYSSYSFTTRH
jgi:hypothetical protein